MLRGPGVWTLPVPPKHNAAPLLQVQAECHTARPWVGAAHPHLHALVKGDKGKPLTRTKG